jgi:hypothetical protein
MRGFRCTRKSRTWPIGTRSSASWRCAASPGNTTYPSESCAGRSRANARATIGARSGGGDTAPDPGKILEEAAKPELVVETANLPTGANAVRDLFASAGGYFEWGIPAKIVSSCDGSLPQIVPLTVDAVVNEVHELRRPIKLTPGGQRTECTLPDRVAKQYLAKKAEWQLPRLAGITTAPLLGEDGSIRAAEGFDRETRLICANVPVLGVADRPTESQAGAALRTLRATFQTAAERVADDLAFRPAERRTAIGGTTARQLFGLGAMVPRPAPYTRLSGSHRAARRIGRRRPTAPG